MQAAREVEVGSGGAGTVLASSPVSTPGPPGCSDCLTGSVDLAQCCKALG